MKAELFTRTAVDFDDEGRPIFADLDEETKILEMDELDEIRVGLEKIVLLRRDNAMSIGKAYNRHEGVVFRLTIDGIEAPTTGVDFNRCRYYYDHNGKVALGWL